MPDFTDHLGDKIQAAVAPVEVSIAQLVTLLTAYENGFNITISVTPKPKETT